ncbi:MAG: response regulator [Gammaproteobacteria bacterium]|nr:response regulator [Gammaproteobacteria bacterium]
METSKTLMIVDDSKVARMMTKSIIHNAHPDWLIVEANDGYEAIELAKKQAIDYFSVDLNMPGIEGFEVIEKICTLSPKAKFALLTANIQQSTHDKATKMNIKCINKPITEQSISQMLEYFND